MPAVIRYDDGRARMDLAQVSNSFVNDDINLKLQRILHADHVSLIEIGQYGPSVVATAYSVCVCGAPAVTVSGQPRHRKLGSIGKAPAEPETADTLLHRSRAVADPLPSPVTQTTSEPTSQEAVSAGQSTPQVSRAASSATLMRGLMDPAELHALPDPESSFRSIATGAKATHQRRATVAGVVNKKQPAYRCYKCGLQWARRVSTR
jgi:hypothetical protein